MEATFDSMIWRDTLYIVIEMTNKQKHIYNVKQYKKKPT